MTYYWSVQAIDPAFGASSFSEEMTFNLVSTGIENAFSGNESGSFIFPNPAQDYFQLNMQSELVNEVCIYKMNGEKVRVINSFQTDNLIDISKLLPGIYIVNYTTPDHAYSEKLMVR